jgi:hypothetical protein
MAEKDRTHTGGMGYGRFAAMIATSTVVMFGLMYLNTYLITDLFWSETRSYMALLMGAAMAVIMLAFMRKMYPSGMVNAAIFAGASVTFALSLWLVRSQITVDDNSYLRAMIPHHSIAVMTSSRANITDPRVRKLADEIIYAQDKEIAEMRYLISAIEENSKADKTAQEPASIMSLQDALSSPDIAVLDLAFLNDGDLAKAFPTGPVCVFTYTQSSPPVLAIGKDGAGLVKLSSDLVLLDPADSDLQGNGATLTAEGITVALGTPDQEGTLNAAQTPEDAELVLSLDAGLQAGYRGFYKCTG